MLVAVETLRGRIRQWVRWWLWGLNVALVLAAAFLALWIAPRAVFLALLVPVAFVPFSYARLRLHGSLGQWLAGRTAGDAVLIASTVASALLDATMAAQFLTARSPAAAPFLQGPAVAWVGPVWFSAYALLFFGYGLAGLATRAARAMRTVLTAARTSGESDVVHGGGGVGRRQFLQQFSIIGAGAPFAVSLAGARLSYDFRVEEREITLPHWPRGLDGLRVAHLSDIHVGGAMNRRRLLQVAALTNAARPDLVLHTGDFLTHRSGDFDVPLYEALARIAAPYGQWACLGNHDFDDPDRLVRRLRDAGVTTLRDTLVTLSIDGQSLEVAGIDFRFGRSDRAAQYARLIGMWIRRATVPRLLLNHDPSAFATLCDGCADLVLSGHTHGGHIGVQLDPDHALTVVGLAGIPDQGVFRRGDMRLFVTRCVGFYGYPMRIGIPPEIALLTIRSPAPDTQSAQA